MYSFNKLFNIALYSFIPFQFSVCYPLTHFQVAQKQLNYDHNKAAFEANKKQLEQYYTSGTYSKEVATICTKAQEYFSTVPVQSNSLVVFDIDDTAVYHYQTMDSFYFIWSKHPEFGISNSRTAQPIKPVLELYNYLRTRGFEVIFISLRPKSDYDYTRQELTKAGYTGFTDLILRPEPGLWSPMIDGGQWKLQARKKLAQTYTIVGCIADREVDFVGGYTGHKVKLPNYLY